MDNKMKKRGMFSLGIAICIAICIAVAILAIMFEKLIPGEMLGSSIVALFIGTIINSFFHPDMLFLRLQATLQQWLSSLVPLQSFPLC